ncbi:hypothetical protein RRG08_042228 [Elysia crispata]|uniref:Uncharacterized protein n=1 Tax=Elysia crispata TaxID=231223 RepID=A0AAE1AT58_9GAST|nr:hypothetical protein RRG08_042228 [Elysia crispata]
MERRKLSVPTRSPRILKSCTQSPTLEQRIRLTPHPFSSFYLSVFFQCSRAFPKFAGSIARLPQPIPDYTAPLHARHSGLAVGLELRESDWPRVARAVSVCGRRGPAIKHHQDACTESGLLETVRSLQTDGSCWELVSVRSRWRLSSRSTGSSSQPGGLLGVTRDIRQREVERNSRKLTALQNKK